MPVSKHRKNRRPYTSARFLPTPVDLEVLQERGRRIVMTRGHQFGDSLPLDIMQVLLHRWSLVGHRASQDQIAGTIETFVWKRNDLWVGFHVRMSAADYPPQQGSLVAVDYLTLMRNSGEEEVPDYATLTGRERVRRVVAALKPIPGTDGPIVGRDPVSFVDAVAARHQECRVADPIGHLRDMADIVLTEPINDPEGRVEALRTLAGLGAYENLTG